MTRARLLSCAPTIVLSLLAACSLQVLKGLDGHTVQEDESKAADAGVSATDAANAADARVDAHAPGSDARAASEDAGLETPDAGRPVQEERGADEPVDGPLVARWRLRNPHAKVAVDTSRTGANGKFEGGARTTTEGLVLDGVDDTVHVRHTALVFDGAVTVMLWLKTTSTSTNGLDTAEEWWKGEWLVDKDTGEPPDNGWAITNHFGKAKFCVNPNGETLISLSRIDDGLWHHIAGVRDTEGRRWLFIDGAIEGFAVGGSVASLSNPEEFYIGSDSGKKEYAKGVLRDVQVHNAALTEAEVRACMADL